MTFLLLLVTLSAGPAVRSEARVWFDAPGEARAELGDLLGELDVCTAGEESGRYFLVIDADEPTLGRLRASGAEVEVTWPDIRDKFRAMTGCDPDDGSFRDFGYFFNYWELADTLRRLAALHPGIVRLDSSMRSHQGRALWCIKISDNPGAEEGEPQVFFNGATHAREPLGTHTCVAFASALCAGYGTDSLVTWLVNNREVYIVPVMNPDGYVYNSDSGGASSNWRKNRRVIQAPYVGVDLNRNYGYKWGFDNSGSSPNPSSETYRGPYRFSEPAVEAIHQFEAAHRFRAQIDFHTYGRYNMYPWAYAGDAPPEQALLAEIADTFQVNNGYTRTGQWYYTLYPSNGASIDWELSDTLDNGVAKFISYAFSCELGINDFWYGASDPAYVDAEVALNLPNCWYLTRLGGAFLDSAGLFVDDTAHGNANGRLDPGEAARLWFRLRNRALHAVDTAQGITSILVSSDTMVRVYRQVVQFTDIPRRSVGDNRAEPFEVTCSPNAAPGTRVALRLPLDYTDSGADIVQPVEMTITIGDSPVAVTDPRAGAAPQPVALLAQPNPCARATVLRASCPDPAGATVRLYDAAGKLVRVLRPDRTGRADWDLCDRGGSQVPAGVYFARLASPSGDAGAVLRVH
ncbi:MAG: M14 family zinc carboxypeptidase [bacterium]